MAKTDQQFMTLHEIVKRARQNLNQHAWDYLVGGTETETTLKRNRQALDSIAFRPRVLRDMTYVDPGCEFMGHKLRLPLLLAPIGSLETFGEGGGATATKAAAEFGVVHMLSSVCNPGLEEVAAAADSLRIFQLYVRGDDAWTDEYVYRAVDAGYFAFCITVDTAHYSRRERDIAKRFVKSWRAQATGTNYQQGLSWDNIKYFKDKHTIPLILKGIATAEDAVIACEHGVEGIYVSNHGGRQLDHGRGSMDVLPGIVAAVCGRAKIIVDGSFMRGTDIIKAIAMGADLVGLGRLECLGIAADGQAGIVRMLELLENEIVTDMGLLGVNRWDQLDSSYLHPAHPVEPAHALSAFPLLNVRDEGY
jgi:glycolate oxidase